jgi:chromosome segregation ATPase
MKETIEALYKHQSETKNTINKEINELRAKIETLKRKRLRIWKNSEKRIQNKMEGQSNRIQQIEDRISELEDEMVIKRKTKELLVKQLKTCEKKMQELIDSIKRPT